MADQADHTQKARALLTARRHGALSTQLQRQPGYPFGSMVNFALDQEYRPLFLLSGLAVHTQNLLVDSRASFLVFASAAEENALAAARLTLLGEVGLIPIADEEAARVFYLQRHPKAFEYQERGDFALYRMAVRESYFIGGFGEMSWIPKLT